MKRMLSLLMTVMLLLAITGCGADLPAKESVLWTAEGLRLSHSVPAPSYPEPGKHRNLCPGCGGSDYCCQ